MYIIITAIIFFINLFVFMPKNASYGYVTGVSIGSALIALAWPILPAILALSVMGYGVKAIKRVLLGDK